MNELCGLPNTSQVQLSHGGPSGCTEFMSYIVIGTW